MKRNDDQTENIFGAVVIMVSDRLRSCFADTANRSLPSAAALISLHGFPDLTIGELAATLALSHSATVRLVDALEADRLLARRSTQDGRVVQLRLTAAGKRLATHYQKQRAQLLRGALAGLSAEDRTALARISDLLVRNLVSTPSQADTACRFCDERVCPPNSCPVELTVASDR